MIKLGKISISTIRSGKGDCIHIRFDGHNIIVDSGPTSTAGCFRELCNSILSSGEELDALFITHYDDDHIGGILKVGDLGFREIFFNAYDGEPKSGYLSAIQNQRLFHTLPSTKVVSSIIKGDVFDIYGAKITIHAPSKKYLSAAMAKMETADTQLSLCKDWSFSLDDLSDADLPYQDTSVSNKASIVFTFEYDDYRVLFCGDALASSIPGGHYNLVKLPHHGSARNISDKMFDCIDTSSFLICADGTSHPNKQTVAKILKHYGQAVIYSNYSWWMNNFITPEDKKYLDNLRFELV